MPSKTLPHLLACLFATAGSFTALGQTALRQAPTDFNTDYATEASVAMPPAASGADVMTCTCDQKDVAICTGPLLVQFKGPAQMLISKAAANFVGIIAANVGAKVRYSGFGWFADEKFPTDVVASSDLQAQLNGKLQLVDSVSNAVLATFSCRTSIER